jgi:hypothetical protein
MSEEKEPYIPTKEELAGESWNYCYSQSFVMPPLISEEKKNGASVDSVAPLAQSRR